MNIKAKEKRRRELLLIYNSWLQTLNPELKNRITQTDSFIVDKILSRYEIIVDHIFRAILEEGHYADPYKVTAGMQLSTLHCQPINTGSPLRDIKLNTLLSFYIGFGFISNYLNLDLKQEVSRNEVILAITSKHLDFLQRISNNEDYELPIISTSLFWETYVELIKSKSLESTS